MEKKGALNTVIMPAPSKIFTTFLNLVKSGLLWNNLLISLTRVLKGYLIAASLGIVLGILIAVKGLISLVEALKRKKKKLMQVRFPVLTIVVGLFIAFGNAHTLVLIIGGILLAVDGIIGLVASLKR